MTDEDAPFHYGEYLPERLRTGLLFVFDTYIHVTGVKNTDFSVIFGVCSVTFFKYWNDNSIYPFIRNTIFCV
jgi:hypothetical protein